MRLFAISDLHVDYPENSKWVEQISNSDYVDDAVIVAGDVSDSIFLVERCFAQIVRKFSRVFYVPGNHELWLSNSDAMDSVDKFRSLCRIAQVHGVHTGRHTVGTTEIVPLTGWYDFSFGSPSEELMNCWMDFHRCKWPENMRNPGDVAKFFLGLNRDRLLPSTRRIVSFSHFLPRIDLMPEYIPRKFRLVYPVLGSLALDRQIRAMGASVHVYGHSHVNRDVRMDGVRYVNNAFGYPVENWTKKSLVCVLNEL